MGVCNSHTSVGNIIGSVVASGDLEFGCGCSFVFPGVLIILVVALVLSFLVVCPEDIGFEPSGKEIELDVALDSGENSDKVESEKVGLLGMENSDSLAAVSLLEAWRLSAVSPFAFCLLFLKLVAYTFPYWLPFYIRHTGICFYLHTVLTGIQVFKRIMATNLTSYHEVKQIRGCRFFVKKTNYKKRILSLE